VGGSGGDSSSLHALPISLGGVRPSPLVEWSIGGGNDVSYERGVRLGRSFLCDILYILAGLPSAVTACPFGLALLLSRDGRDPEAHADVSEMAGTVLPLDGIEVTSISGAICEPQSILHSGLGLLLPVVPRTTRLLGVSDLRVIIGELYVEDLGLPIAAVAAVRVTGAEDIRVTARAGNAPHTGENEAACATVPKYPYEAKFNDICKN
jgi:hypothetical protein